MEEKTEQKAKPTRVDITDVEKLVITKIENDFLKAQVELQQLDRRMVHLQDVAKKCGEKFTAETAALYKKYELDSSEYGFNNVEQAFMLTEKQ